jgi:hypothetical protein
LRRFFSKKRLSFFGFAIHGRGPMQGAIEYWKAGEPTQNMGDFLTELFISRVQAPGPAMYPRLRLIGSVLSAQIIRADLRAAGVAGYWCCGQRDEHAIDPELLARCRFHGVRGPLTRTRLGLPGTTPMGDPALLLPLLHTPRPVPDLAGRSLCIPHFHDPAPDRDILAQTGADLILRPNLPASQAVLLKAIDVICAADFVLAGALHAAIIACAYGRPFAFYIDDFIDLPFKWLDFSASVNIPAVFARNVTEGRRSWQTLLAPALQPPMLAPMLRVFPGNIQPGLLDRAIDWDSNAARGTR